MARFSLIMLLFGAFWPVWVWYIQRYFDRSDEPLGAFALATFLLILFLRREKTHLTPPNKVELITGIASIVLYIATFWWAPKAVDGVFAVTALGIFLPHLLSQNKLRFCDWTLLYMTLPIVSTLNFYLGFPFRFIVAQLASALLWLCRYPVSVGGVSIYANGQFLEIDPPCGGIKILWFFVFLATSFAGMLRFDKKNTFRIIATSITFAILGNPLRVALLFILQVNGMLQGETEHAIHIGIGISVYSILSLVFTWIAISMLPRTQAENTAVSKLQNITPLENRVSLLSKFSLKQRATFTFLCCAAMLIPLIPIPIKSHEQTIAFPGWPQEFEGIPISKLQDSEIIQQYGEDFPGKIAVFSKGKDIVCLRWIAHETRQVHPSADCFQAMGYSIIWNPTMKTANGQFWNSVSCTRATKKLEIRECITDSNGRSWSDVSAWYWDAFLKHTSPPWWSATVISKL